MEHKRDLHAVIVAAGNSTRMGGTDSKIFGNICGETVLFRSVKAFAEYPGIKNIVIVLRERDIPRAAEELEGIAEDIPVTMVCGGRERIDSVSLGVDAIKEKEGILAIHDGARPLVTREIIENAVNAVTEGVGAIPAVPVKDTIKVIDSEGYCAEDLCRSSLRAVQTPQCFILSEYREAIRKALETDESHTDDGSVFTSFGGRVKLTQGSYENIKITTPEDLPVAEELLLRREKI